MRAMLAMLWLGLCCGLGGCIPAVTWSPSLRGRVIDEATGAPVPGALVVASYEQELLVADPPRSELLVVGAAATNADGRFFIHGRPKPLMLGPFFAEDFLPGFEVYYPVYGSLDTSWRATGFYRYELEVTMTLSPQPGGLGVAEPRPVLECSEHGPTCERICAVVHGRACPD